MCPRLLATFSRQFNIYLYWSTRAQRSIALTAPRDKVEMVLTKTDRTKRELWFQLSTLAAGTAAKAATPTPQPRRCQIVMPTIFMKGGNRMSWHAAISTPVATNT